MNIMPLLLLAASLLASLPSRAEPAKVLFFGDSITVGQGLPQPGAERWTARVAAAQGTAEVNEGKGGRPSSALGEFQAVLEKRKEEPGIVRLVIALGANDARDSAPDIAERTARNVGTMIDEARAAAPRWEIVVVGPSNVNKERLQHQEIADMRVRNLTAIAASLQALAAAKNCPYVDFLGMIPAGSLLADGVHPDAAGHAALAAVFLAKCPMPAAP